MWKPVPQLDVEKMNAIVEKLYDAQTVQESSILPMEEPAPTVIEEHWQPIQPIETNQIEEASPNEHMDF